MSIGAAVYDSNWTVANVRVQKLIVLMIRRANVPEILSGMGFFESSFPTMSKVKIIVKGFNNFHNIFYSRS